MKRILLSVLLCSTLTVMSFGQTFPESITMPDNFNPDTILVPASPLSTQVLFVGSVDLVQTTETYGMPAGIAYAKEWHDFIGMTPDTEDGALGWVSVNHEAIYAGDRLGDGGGMTAFRIKRASDGSLEVIDSELPDGRKGQFFNMDFVNTVGETGMNCGGIIDVYTGRIWTAEEWFRTSNESINTGRQRSPTGSSYPRVPGSTENQGVRDTSDVTIAQFDPNNDFPFLGSDPLRKYETFNFMVEVDPRQGKAIRKQVNWGRQGFEGGTVTEDGTVYLGVDATPAFWCKFVPEDNSDRDNIDYTKGKLYVYKHDKPSSSPDGKWVEVDITRQNMFNFNDAAVAAKATMYNRVEWVTIDTATGYVFWTETGRDNPTGRWADEAAGGAVFDEFTLADAASQGASSPTDDANYRDYYGRVWVYDPVQDTQYVWIDGGPRYDQETSQSYPGAYPDKHLSNPDGLSMMYLENQSGELKSYMVICEDLNGSSYNRVPAGVPSRTCELYLLPLEEGPQTTVSGNTITTDHSKLIRITAVPTGAEVTGAVPTPDGQSLLVNSQHPFAGNPFPYNHSLTFAINGFGDAVVALEEEPEFEDANGIQMYPNPATRIVHFSENADFAVYNSNGQRIKVVRNTNQLDISNLPTGMYYIQTAEGEVKKLVVR